MNMFYLTLPSNSSMNFFPDNTVAHFKTKLPSEINLQGDWELGLAEISYPHTWQNIKNGEGWMMVKTERNGVFVRKILHDGYYDSVKDLVNRLQEWLNSEKISLTYDDVTHRVSLKVRRSAEIYFSPTLGEMFDLSAPLYTMNPGTYFGGKIADIHQGFYSMYVYCDLVETVVVGDSLVPLLRIVPIKGKPGEMVTQQYEGIHYKPLQRNHISQIDIYLMTDYGELIPFETGKVSVTVALRRKRPPHFY